MECKRDDARERSTVPALDFSGKEQLYYQLYDILFQDIVSNKYAVGELIPSESELMRTYEVSRATARKAMEMLANNGLIQKMRGRGSEVISNRLPGSPSKVASYIKKGTADKVTPVKRTVYARTESADNFVSSSLGIASDTEVYSLCRVRCSGDVPSYLEVIHIETSLVPGAMECDFSRESWRTFLSSGCNLHWSRATQRIYAVAADEEQAERLGVEPGTPLIYIERLSLDSEGVPRELVQTYYRSDLYHLEIELDS